MTSFVGVRGCACRRCWRFGQGLEDEGAPAGRGDAFAAFANLAAAVAYGIGVRPVLNASMDPRAVEGTFGYAPGPHAAALVLFFIQGHELPPHVRPLSTVAGSPS